VDTPHLPAWGVGATHVLALTIESARCVTTRALLYQQNAFWVLFTAGVTPIP
jgi:hypothetical protein